MKEINEQFGDDYRASLLVLDICKAMDNNVYLISLVGTLAKMAADRTGMSFDRLLEYLNKVHEVVDLLKDGDQE